MERVSRGWVLVDRFCAILPYLPCLYGGKHAYTDVSVHAGMRITSIIEGDSQACIYDRKGFSSPFKT